MTKSQLNSFHKGAFNRKQLHTKRLLSFPTKRAKTFHVITYNFAAERVSAREETTAIVDLKGLLKALPKLLRRPRDPGIQMPFALVSVLEEDLDLIFETLAPFSDDGGGKGETSTRRGPQRLLSQFRDAGVLETRGKVHHVYYIAVYLEGAEPITRFVRNFRHTLNARFGHQPQYKTRKDYESDREQIERLLKYFFQQFGILFNSPDWTGKPESHALWVETTLPVWRSTDETKPLQLHACAKGLTTAEALKHITDHLNALAHGMPEGVRTAEGQPRIGETSEFFDALQAGPARDGISELIPRAAKRPSAGQRFNSIEARIRTSSEPVAAYYPSGQRIMYWFAHPLDKDGDLAMKLNDALTEKGWADGADAILEAALDGFAYPSTTQRPFVLFRPSEPQQSREFLQQFRRNGKLALHTAETRFLNYVYLYFAMCYARGFDMRYFRSYRFTYETTHEAGHIHIFSTVDPLYSPRMVHFVRQLRHLLLNINLSLQDAITRHHWKASQVRAGLSLIIARHNPPTCPV